MSLLNSRNLNKEDFFLSGAVESAPIFYATPTVGAAKAVNENALIINTRGTCRFFLGKNGITKSKDTWLEQPIKSVESSFSKWRKKWEKSEKIFFNISSKSKNSSWKSDLIKLDKISLDFWLDSYRVENTDPFADELESEISFGLKKAKIDIANLHELISPSIPTLTQQISIDKIKVKEGKMSKQDYIRKYWYYKGTWIGGKILSESMLLEEIKSSEPITNFAQRKSLHDSLMPKIDEKTSNLINLLHILFLWREDRKAYMQMLSICYLNLLEQASLELGLEKKFLAWATPSEIISEKYSANILKERAEKSVFYLEKGSSNPIFLTGKDADTIIKNFTSDNKITELKGTIASKGIAKGRARIVLREHHFAQFQPNEILVTTMTRPEYLPLMSKASAIITDEGGLTSHASIVARELKKPCIIGTKIATQVFENGDELEVDADKGIIKKI